MLLVLLPMSLKAQEQETLFAHPIDHGGFGALVIKGTQIADEPALLMGMYGGWLIDHQFMIGIGGYGLVNMIPASRLAEQVYNFDGDRMAIGLGYGGLMLEYIVAPTKLLHLNVQTLIGAGSATYMYDWYDECDDDFWNDDAWDDRHDLFFVLEPAVHAELNLTTWFRIAGGVSYRYITGMNRLADLNNNDLSGISGNLSLKFGAF
ncbi:MAG: hypothetical protein C0600_01325 [Ignavibacteria bacterium]|nr:MAG: hypothetical protein C0600_01325 [Ignavibacteria bacterium]